MTHSGGCLCGAVRFEVEGDIPFSANCHCSRCRRSTGSTYLAVAQVMKVNLKVTEGLDSIETYRTEGFANRSFCKTCGSTLFCNAWPEGDMAGIPMGTFDGDPGITPSMNVGVASKAPWHQITDDLPTMDEP